MARADEPRRTGIRGERKGGRSARVVREVLKKTLLELARSGYASLRVEDVAARAGVNKTTIYRRWPTKSALVVAALRQLMAEDFPLPDTGALASDLLVLAQRLAAYMTTVEGKGASRALRMERDQPEVAAIADEIRAAFETPWIAVIDAAVERGELAAGTDAVLVVTTLVQAILGRVHDSRRETSEQYLEGVVRLVVYGALPRKRPVTGRR